MKRAGSVSHTGRVGLLRSCAVLQVRIYCSRSVIYILHTFYGRSKALISPTVLGPWR